MPLAIVAVLRIVAHDASAELIALNAFSQWLYLPAWAILLLALLVRARALTACSALIVIAHLSWLDLPSLVAASQPAGLAQGTRLRVMSTNLLLSNADTRGIVDEIRAARPDLLLVQELTPDWVRALAASGLHDLLPQRREVAREDAFGIGMYARLPAQIEAFDLRGLPALRADLRVGPGTLRVYNVHTMPPRGQAAAARWNAMFAQLAGLIERERGALLVGGDLNATPHTRWYRQLLTKRLRAVHEDRGRGLATTWPNGRMPFPPIRLDHLLVSPHLAVLDVREGEGRGSDHRPLLCDLVLLP